MQPSWQKKSFPARHFRWLPFLLALATLSSNQAKADLQILITDDILADKNVLKVKVEGAFTQLPDPKSTSGYCGSGSIIGEFGDATLSSLICTDDFEETISTYIINSSAYGNCAAACMLAISTNPGNQSSPFVFAPAPYKANPDYSNTISIPSDYVVGSLYSSSATFSGQSLSSQGFTARGLVGTWSLVGTSEVINVCLGSGPCTASTAVPGPLPLLGASAAFEWSRRMRRRIASPVLPHSRQ
jgi:hypothetical protein